MSEQDGVTIPIHIPLVGNGGEDAARQLKTAQTATESATAAAKQNTEALTAEASAQEALNETLAARQATAADKAYGSQMTKSAGEAMEANTDDPKTASRAAAEDRLMSLISQRMALEEAETEMLQAQAAGQQGKVSALSAEVEVRAEALALQRATLLSEEEATAIAMERFRARETAAMQDSLQEALNARLVAQEAEKLAIEEEQAALQESLNAQLVAEEMERQKIAAAAAKTAIAQAEMNLSEEAGNFERLGTAAGRFAERAALGVNSTRSLMGLVNAMPAGFGVAVIGAVALYEVINRAAEKQKEWAVATEQTSQKMASATKEALTANEEGVEALGNGIDIAGSKLEQLTNQLRLAQIKGDTNGAGLLEDEIQHEQTLLEFMQRQYEVKQKLADAAAAALVLQQASEGWLKEQNAHLQGAADAADRLRDKLASALDPAEKAQAFTGKIDEIKQKLASLGDAAESPEEALYQMTGLTADQQTAVAALVAKWVEYDAEVQKARGSLIKQSDAAGAAATKQDAEWDQFLEKTGEAFDHIDAIKAEMVTQNSILAAQISGNKSLAKELQDQLSSQKEIARLVKEGMAPEEAKAEAAKTQALRDQLDLKEKAAKVKSIDDDDKIKHDEATHNKPALARDQRQKYEDDQRKKLQEAGLSGDDLNKKLASEMHDYNLTHPHDIGGPTKHAENDDLGKQMSDKDWRDQFKPGADHKDPLANPHNPSGDSLNPNHSSAPMSRDNNIPDNLGVTPSHDFDSLKPLAPPAAPPPPPPPPPQAASDHGGGDGGAGAIQSAASALQSAGSSGSAAAGALQAAATALQAAATALQSKGGGGGSGLTGSAGDSSPVGNPPPDNGG